MIKGAQTIAQYKIMRWKVTDSVGESITITINGTGDVIDALSGEILDREGARV